MALALTPSFVEKQNVVLPLVTKPDGVTVRIAALQTDYMGSLTATGAQNKVVWSLFYNKPWLTLEVDPINSNLARLKFTGPTAENGLLQFYVQADDGQTKVKFPVAVEVVEPLSLSISGGRNGRFDNLSAYDAAIPPLVITARGLHNQPITDGTVQFIQPNDLPQGVNFSVSDGKTANLFVSSPDSRSSSGGMVPSKPASYRIKAFRPGSMYDSVDRAFTQEITIGTLSSKMGSLNSAFSCAYNDASNHFHLSVLSDYLEGNGNPYEYKWDVILANGATGSFTNGGGTQDNFAQWTPASAGNVTFKLQLVDAITKEVTLDRQFGPVPVNVASTWDAGSAIKLQVDSPYQTAFVGETIPFVVSIPTADFAAGETVTVTTAITGVSGEPTITAPAGFDLTVGDNSHTINLTVPSGAKFKGKWEIVFTATDGATRSGKLKAVLISKGLPTFSINNNNLVSITQNTGSPITPVKLVASKTTNLEPLGDVAFSLVGAPAGLTIVNNFIVGEVPSTGTHSFLIRGEKAGYAPSFTPASLQVNSYDTPLTLINFLPGTSQAQDGSQINLSWGFTGTAKALYIQVNNDRNVIDRLVNATQYTIELAGTCVYSLVGSDYKGKVYTNPVIVTSSSTAGLRKLPSSPTIATIDSNNVLRMNWSPLTVNDSFGLYDYWRVQTKTSPTATAVDLIDPLSTYTPKTGPTGLNEPGSTLDSRIFVQTLSDSDYWMSMQAMSKNRNVEVGGIEDSEAWPQFYGFPGKLTSGSVLIDKTTVKMKESLTIQLSNIYNAADYWRISYSDGTTTGWLPVSVKTQSKLFTIPGPQKAIVEFERDYSSLTPKVKLRRSLELNIYVQNEVFNSPSVEIIGIGNVGFGGESGFEIADDTDTGLQREPYEVIVKALVKDDVTQELKMLVATSRNNNASSVLNTMAADVFPLAGRPHMKDLVAPISTLVGNTLLVTPVEITTTALPDIYVGKPMPEIQLLATGGTAPYEWYSDSLPFGLKLSVDGTLSGTPLAMGTYNINFSVKDASTPSYLAVTSLVMSIKSDLRTGTVNPKEANVGGFYQNQMIATGGLPPYSWGIQSGRLPVGLSLSTTGLLSGYPATYNSDEDFDTTFTFVAEVVDAVGAIASAEYSIALRPMSLQMGELDQTLLEKGEDFKLTIPIFGGRSPYSVTSFTNDGSIGSSLSIMSPESVDIVSGQGTAPLSIITGDQTFSPTVYPYQAVFQLSAVGGTAPYRWSLNTSDAALNTVNTPTVSASQAAGVLTADGNKKMHITVTDANGTSVSKVISLHSTINSGSGGSGIFSLEYVTVNKNGSTDVMNWTFTKINSLPDAKQGTSYRPDASSFYGVALWNPTANRMYDLRTELDRIQLKHLFSTVGGAGVGATSPLTIRAVSVQRATLPTSTDGTRSTTWWGQGSTAITQALFKSNGAVATDGTPYPATWQDIDNDQLYISQANIGLPSSGSWDWAIGPATTLPEAWRPVFVSSDGTEGTTVTTNDGGYVRLKPTSVPAINFQPLAQAQGNPYILEIVATDANNNSYSALFNFYLISGGSIKAREIGNWLAGTVVIWPDGTTIGYTSPFSKTALGDVLVSGPQSTITLANNTSGTVRQLGTTTPYFPMGVTYYQGDYNNNMTMQMAPGDQTAILPVKGSISTPIGSNPYTFAILNDAGTPEANAKINTLGGYSIGTIVTDNNLSKEMSLACTVDGGGVTPVITVTSIGGDAMANPWASRFDANGVFLGNPQNYADWYFILKAAGGQGPYTYRLENGTTLPGVSVHNAQKTEDFGIGVSSNSPDLASYSGDFLLVSFTPDWTSTNLVRAGQDFVVKVSATDANGFTSTVATIPFRVLPVTTTSIPTTLQLLSNSLVGGTFYINGVDVSSALQIAALNAPAVWTLSGELPAGMFICPQGQPSTKMRGPSVNGGATTNKISAQAVQLIGVPSGTPLNTTINLVATAVGYTPVTIPLTITTVNRIATITVLNGGNAIPGTNYSYNNGSPFVRLHCEGFDTEVSRPSLSTNLGQLGSSYTVNISTRYPGAQIFDLMFDYQSAVSGNGAFTLVNAGELSSKVSFTVMPEALQISGQSITQEVSEYMTVPFTVSNPPVSVQGGTGPYTVEALSVSNSSFFYIQNGKFYLDMTKVAGGNTYTTNVTYKVTDSKGVSATTTTPSTIQVRVIAENYITADFVNRSRNVLGTVVQIDASSFISVQLGHAPFNFFVDNIEFNTPGMESWVSISPTSRYIVVNASTSTVALRDMGDGSVITRATGGGDYILTERPAIEINDGPTFTVDPASLPASGTYTATISLRVVDTKGLSAAGTAVLTLYVP